MRLKLSGPDYRDKDPIKSLTDFRERVKAYEIAYQPLGEFEEKRDLQYIQVRGAAPARVGQETSAFCFCACADAPVDDRRRAQDDPPQA